MRARGFLHIRGFRVKGSLETADLCAGSGRGGPAATISRVRAPDTEHLNSTLAFQLVRIQCLLKYTELLVCQKIVGLIKTCNYKVIFFKFYCLLKGRNVFFIYILTQYNFKSPIWYEVYAFQNSSTSFRRFSETFSCFLTSNCLTGFQQSRFCI